MLRLFAVVSVLGATTAALAAPPPVIGGTPDSGDPAVVQLLAYPADKSTLYTCTAEVISPTALLTAAHCVDHEATFVYGVYFGADANSFNGQIRNYEPHLKAVSATHIHPMYSRSSPFFGDIAVVNLAEATDVTPLAFNRVAPTAALVGAAIRLVGYGQIVAGQNNNAKYMAGSTIGSIDGLDTLLAGDAQKHTCVGDSGGPVLKDNVIYGVDSYSASGCVQAAHFRRTDYFADFIDQYAGTHPEDPSDDGDTTDGTTDGTDSTDDGDDTASTDAGDQDDGGCSASTPASNLALSGLVLAGLMAVGARRKRG